MQQQEQEKALETEKVQTVNADDTTVTSGPIKKAQKITSESNDSAELEEIAVKLTPISLYSSTDYPKDSL